MTGRFAPAQRSNFCFRVLRVLALLAIAVQWTAPGAHASLATTGKWSPSANWDPDRFTDHPRGYAISLNLVRGDGSPFHSRIRWWSHDLNETYGGDWGWKPGAEGCETYPDTSIYFKALPADNSGINVFCSGATTLAEGRLLITGGNDPETDTYGEKRARIWTPGSGSSAGTYSTPGDMNEWRWYPTATALADGKALVLSGAHHLKHIIFSGKRNSALPTGTVADSVAIFSPVAGGQWEQSIIPAADPLETPGRPEARWLHSAAQMEQMTDFKAQVYFGGKDDQGEPLSDTWLLKRDWNVTGADFAYRWDKINPSSPPARSGHTAMAVDLVNASVLENNMVVFGGLDHLGDAKNTTHRLRKSVTSYAWAEIATSNPPSARHGHTAIYDATTISGTPTRRMIVFGGAGSNGSVLPDTNVYELRFGSDPDVATWHVMQRADLGPGPTPRFGHVMGIDLQHARTKVVQDTTKNCHAALMFGGQTGSTSYSNQLWILWIFDDGKVGWEKKNFGGETPSARARASMLVDPLQGEVGTAQPRVRLYLFGGENGNGDVDTYQYIVDPWGSYPTWTRWAATGRSASGHTVLMDQGLSTVRVAEVFDPAGGSSGTFTKHPSSQLFQHAYPTTFVIPGGSTAAGRVLTMAVDNEAYYLDVAANGGSSTWTRLTNANLGFACEAGVMYRPGKILMAALIDSAGTLVGRSKKLDANNLFNAWQNAGPQTGTFSFTPRRFHNLVLLPNGQVMAVGGMKTFNNNNTVLAVFRPQIWDPDADQGAGVWTDSSLLAIQPHRRNYHSTAMLLPDGRVVSAGGDYTNDMYMGEVYCPPYLFNGDNLATRPTLIAATGRWRYNTDVTIAVSGDTTIRLAALIRAPATTHAFDESQRYVPLTLLSSSVRGDGVRQYFLKAPPDSFHAPPGDYLLFVSNAAGVPAIAQWVRVGSKESGQFDTSAPDELTFSTTFIYCDAISPIYWTAPGDNGATGIALDYDIRYSWSPITEGNFPQATPMTDAGIPQLAGTVQTGAGFTGLSPATMLYVAGKTKDKAGNLSSYAFAEFGTLPSCGGGGYGTSAGRTRDENSGPRTSGASAGADPRSRAFARPTSMLPGNSPLRLVGEFELSETVRWRIAYQDLSGDSDLLATSSNQAVIQERLADGRWQTQRAATLLAGSVGVRSLARDGRVVFPLGTSIESLELEPRGYTCDTGDHSRLGDLVQADSLDLAGEFSTGDTLTLAFSSTAQPGEGQDCFFRVRAPGEPRTAASRPRGVPSPRDPQPNDLPMTFALHTARPNPFSSATTMRFDLPKSAEVTLEMFDVQGRLIAVLANGTRDAGRHSVVWDGRTGGDRRAPAGVYLCRMTAGDFVTERRVSLLP